MIKELEYELTKKDVSSFMYYHSFRSKSYCFTFLILFFLGLGLLLMKIFDTGIFMIFFTIIFFLLAPVIGVIRFKKQNACITINDDLKTFNAKNSVGNTEYNWCKIEKICNIKHSFLIYITKNCAIIIPKRIFETEQEMNETWELIQECYNKYREELK